MNSSTAIKIIMEIKMRLLNNSGDNNVIVIIKRKYNRKSDGDNDTNINNSDEERNVKNNSIGNKNNYHNMNVSIDKKVTVLQIVIMVTAIIKLRL